MQHSIEDIGPNISLKGLTEIREHFNLNS